jgi:hypothetical protein
MIIEQLRIGVVISVLWLVVFTTCLAADTNQRLNEHYKECLRMADLIASTFRDAGQSDRALAEQQVAHGECWRFAETIPLDRLARYLLVENPESASLFTAMFGPIALFWLLGGAIFAAVHWHQRLTSRISREGNQFIRK